VYSKIRLCKRLNVRFAPKATELLRGSEMTRCAISRLMHRNKKHLFDQLAISAEQLSFSDWKLRITSFGLST
jgi:hypothetical protein